MGPNGRALCGCPWRVRAHDRWCYGGDGGELAGDHQVSCSRFWAPSILMGEGRHKAAFKFSSLARSRSARNLQQSHIGSWYVGHETRHIFMHYVLYLVSCSHAASRRPPAMHRARAAGAQCHPAAGSALLPSSSRA